MYITSKNTSLAHPRETRQRDVTRFFDLLKACTLQPASKGTRYKAAAEIFFYTARPSNMSLFFHFC